MYLHTYIDPRNNRSKSSYSHSKQAELLSKVTDIKQHKQLLRGASTTFGQDFEL